MRLRVDSLAFGGEGVGRTVDGQVVFVAGTAPGDEVEVELLPATGKARFRRAELLRVVEPGQRVAPPCRYHARCGGCPWQQVASDAQARAKQEIVTRALSRLPGIVVEPLQTAPQAWGYRTRARMTVESNGRKSALGFFGRRSHQVVEVAECIALEPVLDRALQRLAGIGLSDGTEVAGVVGPDGQIHLSVSRAAPVSWSALLDEVVVGIDVEGRAHGRRLQVDGVEVHGGGFAQANWAQNRWLVERAVAAVVEALPAEGRVLELYAGAGNFTRALATTIAHGVAVEGAPDAGRALQRLLAEQPGWSVRVEPDARTAGWLAEQTFDVALLDPPRAGAKELVPALGRTRHRIVYVSCDPMTLARDVTALAAAGFTRGRVWPVDMMPQTAHIEALCVLDRVDPEI